MKPKSNAGNCSILPANQASQESVGTPPCGKLLRQPTEHILNMTGLPDEATHPFVQVLPPL
jgi:hypothetical protein